MSEAQVAVRRATADETLALPDIAVTTDGVILWPNFTEDPNTYYVTFSVAMVVPEDVWEECRANGVLCHKGRDGNFYIAV